MILFHAIRTTLALSFATILFASNSARAVYAELAKIDEVHLYVLVTPRGTYPDPEAEALRSRLQQAITKVLSASGIQSLRYITDGSQFAPCLDVHITWDTVEPGSSLAFVHTSIQLRESALIERLRGVPVSKGAVTWQNDELSHVQIKEVEPEIQRVITSRLARLIDDIQFATKATSFKPKHSNKVITK